MRAVFEIALQHAEGCSLVFFEGENCHRGFQIVGGLLEDDAEVFEARGSDAARLAINDLLPVMGGKCGQHSWRSAHCRRRAACRQEYRCKADNRPVPLWLAQERAARLLVQGGVRL